MNKPEQMFLFEEFTTSASRESTPTLQTDSSRTTARITPSPAKEPAEPRGLAQDPPSPSNTPDWFPNWLLGSSSGKTSRDASALIPAGTTMPSSVRWFSAGMSVPGGFWTHNMSEAVASPEVSRRGAKEFGSSVCGLSDVLEPTSPRLFRYFLSKKAATGILRRAESRGKDLPPLLATALHEMIAWWDERGEPTNPPAPKTELSKEEIKELMEMPEAETESE